MQQALPPSSFHWMSLSIWSYSYEHLRPHTVELKHNLPHWHPARSCECNAEVISHMLGEERLEELSSRFFTACPCWELVTLSSLMIPGTVLWLRSTRTAQTHPGHWNGLCSGSWFGRWCFSHWCPSTGVLPQHLSHRQAGQAEWAELRIQGGLAPSEAVYPLLTHQLHDSGPRLPHAGHYLWRTLQRSSLLCEVQWALAPTCTWQAGPSSTGQGARKCPLQITVEQHSNNETNWGTFLWTLRQGLRHVSRRSYFCEKSLFFKLLVSCLIYFESFPLVMSCFAFKMLSLFVFTPDRAALCGTASQR